MLQPLHTYFKTELIDLQRTNYDKKIIVFDRSEINKLPVGMQIAYIDFMLLYLGGQDFEGNINLVTFYLDMQSGIHAGLYDRINNKVVTRVELNNYSISQEFIEKILQKNIDKVN